MPFVGQVEVNGRRYLAASFEENEGRADVEARIGRQQKAAAKVLEVLEATAIEHNVHPKNVLSELKWLLEIKKD